MQLNYTKEAPQGIVIETVGNKDILFEKEYEKAQIAIEDIVFQQLKSNGNDFCEDRPLINNRIIFTGQRGSGKTSALLSLKSHLKNKGINITNKKKAGIHNINFYCLPTIDPSYFDGENNILTTVLSSMFYDAKKVMENYDKQGVQRRNDYEDLLKKFSKVYKALGQIMPSGNNQSFTIERLNDVSNASDINSLMDKLLKSFKRFLKDDNDKLYKFLLVIDDLDMNVACAAEMMEQVRKFLSLNDMVILMSANMDQLHYEMCEHYSKAFVNTMNDKDQARFIEVEDMASRYLLKLFPTSRRINVEHPISQLLNATLAFREEDGIDAEGNVNYKTIREGVLQPTILSLIWDKTRLLFVPERNELHPIIPTNLRELVQFIDVLENMDSVKSGNHNLFDNVEEYTKCEGNISKFKEYFLKTWVPTNLSIEEENVFYSIPEKVDEINKYLINAINVIGSNNKKRLMSREVDLDIIEKNAEGVRIDRDIYTMVSPNDPRFVKANKISDIFNQPSNYSYGDLLLMLDKYETYFESEHDRKFSNAIKIYYSILLFETMFYRSNCVNYNAHDGEAANEIASNLKNRVNDIIPIQRLIGGTIYYPNYFEIITSKYFKQKGPSYDAKRAFYHKVKEDETDDMPLFSVLYYGDIRPDRYDTKHVYDTTYEHDSEVDSENYKTFDILSIINNMLNPWQTIARADYSKININHWKELIDNWKNYSCRLVANSLNDDTIIQFPNSILPFYSVDMMLKYIRITHDVQEIYSDYNDKKYKAEEDVANWLGLVDYENIKIDFRLVKSTLNKRHHIDISYKTLKNEYIIKHNKTELIDLLEQMGIVRDGKHIEIKTINAIKKNLIDILLREKIIVEKGGSFFINKEAKDSDIIKVLRKHKIIQYNKFGNYEGEYTINTIPLNPQIVQSLFNKLISVRVVRSGNNITIINDSDYKLYKGIQIVLDANKYKRMITDTDRRKEIVEKKINTANADEVYVTYKDGVGCFRDYVIAKIMSLYSGGQREQDMLIKNLYRYNSITEMYRYLVDVLWKDAIIEYGIRQEIQQTVHSRKFIIEYYKKLLKTTEMCFKEAFGEEKTYIIYKGIFEQAVKIFIQDETA